MMKATEERLTAACPKLEDTTHILTCQSQGAKIAWKAKVLKLGEWLLNSNACQPLAELMIYIVNSVKDHTNIPRNECY